MNQESTSSDQPALTAEGEEEPPTTIREHGKPLQNSNPNPVSPLEPLDPHRLRDMVVDKQTASAVKTSVKTLESPVPPSGDKNEQVGDKAGEISDVRQEHEFRSPTTPRQPTIMAASDATATPTSSMPIISSQSGHGRDASGNGGQSDRRMGKPGLMGSPLPPQSPFQQPASAAGTTPTGARSPPYVSNSATPQQHPLPQFAPVASSYQPSPGDPSQVVTAYFPPGPQTPGYSHSSNMMDVGGVQPTVPRPMVHGGVPVSYMGPYPGQPHWGAVQHPGNAYSQQAPPPVLPPPRFISHVQMGRVPYPMQGYPMYLHPSQMGYTPAPPQTLTSPGPSAVSAQAPKSQHGSGTATAKGQKGKRQPKKAVEQNTAPQQPQQQRGTPTHLPAAAYQSPTYQQHPVAVGPWGGHGANYHPMQQAGYGYQQAPHHPHYQQQAMATGSPYLMHAAQQPYQYAPGAFPPPQMLGATMAPRYPPPPRHPSQQQQPSPHYLASPTASSDQSPVAGDMRSPPIVSPGHIGQVPPSHPHQAVPQFHHQQPLQPPQQQPHAVMRATPAYMGHYPAAPVFYYGHDPAQAARCSPEICLAGCVFLVLEEGYPPQLQFQVDRSTLPAVIRFYGGDVEQPTPRGIPERVTHVLCSSIYPQSSNKVLLQQALSDSRKRLVTYHWLNETLMRRRMEPPIKACHLPTCCGEGNRPAVGKLVAVSGFDELETSNVKLMITAIGGVHAKSISGQSHILIVKQGADPALVERARQLGHQVVNYQWLMEIYLGNMRAWADWENPTFSANNLNSSHAYVSAPTYLLERVSEFCQKLLAPWKVPIALSDDVLRLAIHMKTLVSNDKTVLFPHRQFKLTGDTPTEEQIDKARQELASKRSLEGAPNDDGESSTNEGIKETVRVHFDGLLPAQVRELGAKIKFLGGDVADSTSACTHLVVPNLERSLKLLEALAAGKDVVSPEWIQQSYSLMKLIDCNDFSTHDAENERKYCFNLRNTLLRARRRRVFQDVTFHLSDSVKPSFEALSHLISTAGGTVQRERPLKKQLARCIETDTTYLVIVNRDDVHFYKYLTACNFPLFNEEFVLMSITRHKIEPATHYRVLPPPSLIANGGATNGSAMAQRTCSSTQPVIARERNTSSNTISHKKESSVCG